MYHRDPKVHKNRDRSLSESKQIIKIVEYFVRKKETDAKLLHDINPSVWQ